MPRILKHKKAIFVTLATSTIILGLIGFSLSKDSTGLQIINHTLGLFIFEWVDYEESLILDLATFLGVLTIFLGFLTLFFSKYFQAWQLNSIQKKPYNIIIGLSEQNISLLKNNCPKESTIIIEKDKAHPEIEKFKTHGFSIIAGHTKQALKSLNLSSMERCIISTENDRKNIALAKLLISLIDNEHKQTIYICITNRDLNVLFKQDVIASDKRKNITVVTYSLYENMAKSLFLKHSILGEKTKIINSKDDFNMILIGDSNLAIELVYHISFLSTLPNENKLTLYLVGSNSNKFLHKIKKLFPKIEKIPHLTLEAKEINNESLDFYEDKVWESKNLTNILIATTDEEKNLDIAINLQDTTYIRQIGHNQFKTKVLFALYHNLGLGEEIDKNKKAFHNFYTFGNISQTSTKEILLNEELDLIAKLIHNNYRGEKDVKTEILYQNWLNTTAHKQDANKTQALHIDVKLLAFGLKRVNSKKSFDELLKINEEIFYNLLKNNNTIKEQLKSYKSSYFPNSFENTLLDKVARAEHNRWNAFHYLNGWQYNTQRKDDAKEHDCLQPLEDFNRDEIKETYQYDIASVYYMPQYLARGGFEMLHTIRH